LDPPGTQPEPENAEPQDLANEQTDRPGSVDRDVETDQESAESWRNAVPGLRDQWQKHQEKWPDSERQPVNPSLDEPGCWRNDSGFTLNARDNGQVEADYDGIAKSEEKITGDMTDLARTSTGHLVGLDRRLKEGDRYKEKVATQKAINPDAEVHEVIASIRDGVRYTLQYNDSDYARGVLTDVEAMKRSGNELLKLKTFWDADEYKGINSQWREPETGQAFEVQFHTPISFDAKQLTHGAYERLRTMDPRDSSRELEASELHDFQRTVCSIIPIPVGAMDIPDYP
jgi:hypothetical protein